jgi:hypothetical protein
MVVPIWMSPSFGDDATMPRKRKHDVVDRAVRFYLENKSMKEAQDYLLRGPFRALTDAELDAKFTAVFFEWATSLCPARLLGKPVSLSFNSILPEHVALHRW